MGGIRKINGTNIKSLSKIANSNIIQDVPIILNQSIVIKKETPVQQYICPDGMTGHAILGNDQNVNYYVAFGYKRGAKVRTASPSNWIATFPGYYYIGFETTTNTLKRITGARVYGPSDTNICGRIMEGSTSLNTINLNCNVTVSLRASNVNYIDPVYTEIYRETKADGLGVIFQNMNISNPNYYRYYWFYVTSDAALNVPGSHIFSEMRCSAAEFYETEPLYGLPFNGFVLDSEIVCRSIANSQMTVDAFSFMSSEDRYVNPIGANATLDSEGYKAFNGTNNGYIFSANLANFAFNGNPDWTVLLDVKDIKNTSTTDGAILIMTNDSGTNKVVMRGGNAEVSVGGVSYQLNTQIMHPTTGQYWICLWYDKSVGRVRYGWKTGTKPVRWEDFPISQRVEAIGSAEYSSFGATRCNLFHDNGANFINGKIKSFILSKRRIDAQRTETPIVTSTYQISVPNDTSSFSDGDFN